MKLVYRPEIDGLRAIAIVSVVLYHAEIIFFKGGFIGVDIFFVISGYLITALILKELKSTGGFSFLNFYARRVRRIIPALFFVMLASLPPAWIYLIPTSFADYSTSILYSIAFSSNFYFHFSGSQYGAENALFIPFLHTWSLSVEEQFYIIFPVILLITHKYFKNYMFPIIIGGLFLSLHFADWGSHTYPSATFYFLPSRMWELLSGATLAYLEANDIKIPIPKTLNKVLPFLGLIFIGYSIVFYDFKMHHPSYQSVLPIIGTCLMIWCSNKDELTTKILSSKIFVGMGLISYSLYLWHYPVFAFSRIKNDSPSEYDKFEWILLTLAVSTLSYFLIEKPYRNKNFSKKYLRLPLISALLILLTTNFLVVYKEGFRGILPGVFNTDVFATSKALWVLKDEKGPCYQRDSEFCTFNKGGKRRVFLVGDSHMAAIMGELKISLTKKDYIFSTSTMGGCWYLPGFNRVDQKTNIPDACNISYQQNLRKNLLNEKNGIVVLGGRMPLYLNHEYFDNREGGFEAGSHGFKYEHAKKTKNYKEGVIASIKELLENHQNVILIYPIPEVGWNLPRKLYQQKKSYFKTMHFDPITTSYTVYKDRTKESFELLDKVQHPNLYRVYPHALFCDNKVAGRCITHSDNDLFYVDSNHLSIKGAQLLNELILEKIEFIQKKIG